MFSCKVFTPVNILFHSNFCGSEMDPATFEFGERENDINSWMTTTDTFTTSATSSVISDITITTVCVCHNLSWMTTTVTYTTSTTSSITSDTTITTVCVCHNLSWTTTTVTSTTNTISSIASDTTITTVCVFVTIYPG